MYANALVQGAADVQTTVKYSTAGAEHDALTLASTIGLSLRNLLLEFEGKDPLPLLMIGTRGLDEAMLPFNDRMPNLDGPSSWTSNLPSSGVPVVGDNLASLQELGSVGHGSRLKHLRLKAIFNAALAQQGHMVPFHLPSAQLPADVFTKATVSGGERDFKLLRDMITGQSNHWNLFSMKPIMTAADCRRFPSNRRQKPAT